MSSLLTACLLVGLLPTVALAKGDAHTHCVCGGDTDVGDHATHTDVTYQPWDGTSAIDYGNDNTAYVCLTGDVTIQNKLEITGGKTLYLCLNGKTFTSNGTKKIVVKENSRLILCDCAGGGIIDGADSGWGGTGIYLYSSTMDMYGGKIPAAMQVQAVAAAPLHWTTSTVSLICTATKFPAINLHGRR